MSNKIKKLSDQGNRDGYKPTYGVTFPDPFFKCSAAHRQSPAENWFFIETENIDCMVDMREFPKFTFEEPPRFTPPSVGSWDFDSPVWKNHWKEWCAWHERKILAVAQFFHLQHCKTCLYNMIREKYFPQFPEIEHQHK